jgi:predicted MFS family arabinose efflux permease
MQYVLLMLGSVLGGVFARENPVKAVKIITIALIVLVLYFWGKQHP